MSAAATPALREPKPRVIAVAGGKGGTGKSLLAANLGVFLATLGKRVVLIDASLGSANLHIFVGLPRPHRTLSHVLGRGPASLADTVEPTPIPGLQIVAGEGDPAWSANPRTAQVERLTSQIGTLPADFVVVDLGPGTATCNLDLFLAADIGLLVAVPEPTSVEVCYRFVRAAFLRHLRRTLDLDPAQLGVGGSKDFAGGIPAPLDLYVAALASDPELAARIKDELLRFTPHLVINCARSKGDMELGRAIAVAARRRMGVPMVYLGHLEYDEAVWVAVRRRAPLLVEHPESRVSKCIEKVTRRLQATRDTEPIYTDIFAGDTFYDLLEVPPTSSFEDIRRANRRIRDVYAHDSVVMSGLYTRERLDELHRRFDEAYATLMDATQRKLYDQQLFPEGVPAAPEVESSAGDATTKRLEIPLSERPPMPELGVDTIYTGALIRQIREARGIDLREVSERTKIGMAYLEAIEGEAFRKLPPVVYVRGFLVEYCKLLQVDKERLLETYLDRYRAGRVTPGGTPTVT